MESGFWTGITVVQTPEAPGLNIRPAPGGKVVLSWPVTVDGFVLEENPSPGSLRWARTQTAVIDTRTEHTVTVPAVGVIKCYRLRKE